MVLTLQRRVGDGDGRGRLSPESVSEVRRMAAIRALTCSAVRPTRHDALQSSRQRQGRAGLHACPAAILLRTMPYAIVAHQAVKKARC